MSKFSDKLYVNLYTLVQSSCYEVGMLPGDNIFNLPNMIKKLVRERDELSSKVAELQYGDLESSEWINRGR